METLYRDANLLIAGIIRENMPEEAVRIALKAHSFRGRDVSVVAIGKAAWRMAQAACEYLAGKFKSGLVITKYGHSLGAIAGMEIIEAGHPLSDENTIAATEKAVQLARGLTQRDELLFLVSGGGSALFELPLPGLTLGDITDMNRQLLSCGADIVEVNTIRKRLSAVKAGRFAQACAPAQVFTVALSDVLTDRLDCIACGPAVGDTSTADDAAAVVRKYGLAAGDTVMGYLAAETIKSLDNADAVISGSVRNLCASAERLARQMGYTPHLLCTDMNGQAHEAGRLISSIARQINSGQSAFKRPCAVILGGETVVTVTGRGRGGRNQELALAACEGIAGIEDLLVFSIGSDGTDGPTDAAGGMVDGCTARRLKEQGINITDALNDNDSYTALAAADSLVITGPTGTNVNDVTMILCR